MRLALLLPRDSASVPMARRIVATTLRSVGVTEDCRGDILLALVEACSNAVTHAQPVESYEVSVEIDDRECRIEVHDAGKGFDPDLQVPEAPSPLDEAGRGLFIIRALADQFVVAPAEPTGTLVRFTKRLERSATA